MFLCGIQFRLRMGETMQQATEVHRVETLRGCEVVNLTRRPSSGRFEVLIYVRGGVEPRAIERLEELGLLQLLANIRSPALSGKLNVRSLCCLTLH
jgi:hypothetical protein